MKVKGMVDMSSGKITMDDIPANMAGVTKEYTVSRYFKRRQLLKEGESTRGTDTGNHKRV